MNEGEGRRWGGDTFLLNERRGAASRPWNGDITQPEVITAILTALKLPTEAPPIARARDPAELKGA